MPYCQDRILWLSAFVFCVANISACARNDGAQLTLEIELDQEGAKPDSIIVYLRRVEGGRAFSTGVNLVPFSALEPPGEDRKIFLTIPFEDDFQGRVSAYVVACVGMAHCLCREESCSEEARTLGPDCTCSGPAYVGLATTELSSAVTSALSLRILPSFCDRDGDLFPACLGEESSDECCGGLDAPEKAAIHDCHDLPLPEGCEGGCDACGIRGCDTRFAHPFRPKEPSAESGVEPALVFRHRAWCQDGLINDCRGDADVACGDLDDDGSPFGPLDCDDDDPGVSASAEEICGDGKDQDCRGGDKPCDEDRDGVLAGQDCDDQDPDRFPGNPEICGDGIDQDCSGDDEVCLPLSDLDGDGSLCETEFPWDDHACLGPGEDCNDLDSRVFPGAPEICDDQIDQDCDGQDLACRDGDADGDGFISGDDGGTDCDDNDPNVMPGGAERCGDDIDQDCNGRDLSCDALVDADDDGYAPPADCNDRGATIHPHAPEICNRVDDDCDGFVDEGNPLLNEAGAGASAMCGAECVAQPCACRLASNVCTRNVQTGTALIQCLGIAPNDRAEQCSGIDEDCDGRFNEGVSLACYTGMPAETEGVGICVGGQGLCRTAANTTGVDVCGGQVTPGIEQCNAFDDDCDGGIDEEVVRPCGQDEGECRAGYLQCVGGVFNSDAECIGEVRPEVEICDNLDNDCDGLVDLHNGQLLSRTCYEGEQATAGMGICRAGTQLCIGGRWGSCDDQVLPASEECNGNDDDCDGTADDGIDETATQCGRGECAAVGRRSCVNGVLQDSCRPGASVPEVCDGLDNDCDGDLDEDMVREMTTCGVGACSATGLMVCTDGDWVDSCAPLTGQIEVCDSMDNDCNGVPDDGLEMVRTRCGQGACEAEGTLKCVDGRSQDSCTPNVDRVSAEVCDDFDNDCDGRLDEGPGGTSVCDQADPGGMMVVGGQPSDPGENRPPSGGSPSNPVGGQQGMGNSP